MPELHVVNHPLVSHKLTQMRRTETPSERFRQLLTETSLLLAYEVTRELPLRSVRITTPMTDTDQPELVEEPVVVSILRAGNGLLDGVLRVIPRPGWATSAFTGTTKPSRRSSTTASSHHWRDRRSSSSTRCWPPGTQRAPPSTG